MTPIPCVKPLGEGAVRVRGRELETDFDGDGAYEPFQVRGVAYGIFAIGVGLHEPVPHLSAYVDHSKILLEAMHANTNCNYADPGNVDARQRQAKAALRLKPANPNQQLRLLGD